MKSNVEGWCRLKELPQAYQQAIRSGIVDETELHSFPVDVSLGWKSLSLLTAVFFLVWVPLLNPANWSQILSDDISSNLFLVAILLIGTLIGSISVKGFIEIRRVLRERQARSNDKSHFAAWVGPHDLVIRPIDFSWRRRKVLYFKKEQLRRFEVLTSGYGSQGSKSSNLVIGYFQSNGERNTIFLSAFLFGSEQQTTDVAQDIWTLVANQKSDAE